MLGKRLCLIFGFRAQDAPGQYKHLLLAAAPPPSRGCQQEPVRATIPVNVRLRIMHSLRVRCTKDALLTVQRSSRWKRRMAYILVANRSYKYRSGKRSRIIYIGTTGEGANRPATSAVDKAGEAFSDLHGVKQISVHIASCRGRKALRTWEHLESALLATFREIHWELPKYNKKKGFIKDTEDIKLFRVRALKKLLGQFSD